MNYRKVKYLTHKRKIDKEKEKILEEKWKNITITNNFMFIRVFSDQNICKNFLKKLLNIKITSLSFPDIEKTIDGSIISKSIRLDVYTTADTEVFDIEMQVASLKEKNIAKRTRYYQSKIDQSLLDKGNPYSKLLKSFIIFICTFDPFNKGLAYYLFENVCVFDTSIHLGDDTKKIFLNTKGDTKGLHPDIISFLKYCDDKSIDSEFTKTIDEKVEEVKNNAKERSNFMTFQMELDRQYELGREEGREEGRNEGILGEKLETVKRLLAENFSLDIIQKATNLTIDQIKSCVK